MCYVYTHTHTHTHTGNPLGDLVQTARWQGRGLVHSIREDGAEFAWEAAPIPFASLCAEQVRKGQSAGLRCSEDVCASVSVCVCLCLCLCLCSFTQYDSIVTYAYLSTGAQRAVC